MTELWSLLPKELCLSRYLISTLGRVANRDTNYILSGGESNGYPTVLVVDDNGKAGRNYVHRLVAYAFIPNPENKPTVNHKNHIRYDNQISNLEWATYAEQNQHRLKPLRIQALRVIQKNYDGVVVKIWDSARQVMETLGLMSIPKYLTGISRHPNYIWEYDNELLPGEVFCQLQIESGHVFVSNKGRICRKNGSFFYGSITSQGYLRCDIQDREYRMHRLVAAAFLERPLHLESTSYDELVVNHLDGDKTNNVAENLEWCTHQENSIHAVEVLGVGAMRPVVQYDLHGKRLDEFRSLTEAAAAIYGYASNICECCRRNIKSAYGYIWRYLEDELGDFSTDRLVTAVVQYNRQGKRLEEFPSIKRASEASGAFSSSISACCSGRNKTAGGYIWRYANDELGTISPYRKGSPVVQYDLQGQKRAEFGSIKEASDVTGVCDSNISACCLGNYHTAGGFIWRYM